MNDAVKEIAEAILNFDHAGIEQKVRAALESGADAQTILNDGMIRTMGEVGRRFEEGEFFIPEMLLAATTMEKGLAVLQPRLVQAGARPAGTVVIGTVKGDLHDVGKSLVAMMFRGAGFEVVDLGVDVPPEQFVEKARSHKADIVAMSALLTTTMTGMKSTIEALREAGLRKRVKVMVGGAPLSDAYAREIGADGYAPDAASAADMALQLIGA